MSGQITLLYVTFSLRWNGQTVPLNYGALTICSIWCHQILWHEQVTEDVDNVRQTLRRHPKRGQPGPDSFSPAVVSCTCNNYIGCPSTKQYVKRIRSLNITGIRSVNRPPPKRPEQMIIILVRGGPTVHLILIAFAHPVLLSCLGQFLRQEFSSVSCNFGKLLKCWGWCT